MPRAFSSGALSIWSNDTAVLPLVSANTCRGAVAEAQPSPAITCSLASRNRLRPWKGSLMAEACLGDGSCEGRLPVVDMPNGADV